MSILFQPQRLGRIEIQNRLVRSATYYGLADENGRVGDASVELMKTLAGNEVGLIITGYAFVARSGQVFPDMNGIDSDEQIPGYRRMTQAVHDLQGRVVMQIAHGGVASATAVRRGEPRLAVSAGEGPSDSENGSPGDDRRGDRDDHRRLWPSGSSRRGGGVRRRTDPRRSRLSGHTVPQSEKQPPSRSLGREPREQDEIRRRGGARDQAAGRRGLPGDDQARMSGTTWTTARE